ncbi:MAG: hypothetical protein LBJ02_09560 [Bifidobacteriaceae bacterium]|jgi:hypothetical protein|nr:hypothetical protein [Bifidobacteriaceae bacterium]
MRTTLTLDDDVFYAIKQRARAEHRSAGEVVSDLVRRALTGAPADISQDAPSNADSLLEARGVRLLPHRGGIVTNELVNRLREELGE